MARTWSTDEGANNRPMMDALRILPNRQRVACSLLTLILVASGGAVLAQQPVTIGAASGPSVEVNLDAIYGGAARPAPPTVFGAPDRPRGLLIPNMHDPDTGAVIGEGRVRLVPPREAQAVASRDRPVQATSGERVTTTRVPLGTLPERGSASPPTPAPPPIRPTVPKPEMAMKTPAPATSGPRTMAKTPAPPPVRALTPAAPTKPMVEKMAKPMPEPPALPPAPPVPALPDSAMPKPVTPRAAAPVPPKPERTMPAPSPVEKMMAERAVKPAVPDKPSATTSATSVPKAPPAPPQAARTLSAPAQPTRLASLPPGGDSSLQLRFGAGSAAISTADEATLKRFADDLKASEDRVQLRAYADDSGGNASKARRLSLSRALAVRSYLIESGLRSTRIDVRALGAVPDGGPADRVDIIRLDR